MIVTFFVLVNKILWGFQSSLFARLMRKEKVRNSLQIPRFRFHSRGMSIGSEATMTTPILRKRTNYLSFISNLFFKLSINIAPNGAVINIATTAAVSTNVPQASPSDKAIAPIDAWTVAFGR